MAAASVFLIVVWVSRVISLGSIAATLTLPPAALLSGASPSIARAAIGAAALILFRHRANLQRILSGTERRMGLRTEPLGGKEDDRP